LSKHEVVARLVISIHEYGTALLGTFVGTVIRVGAGVSDCADREPFPRKRNAVTEQMTGSGLWRFDILGRLKQIRATVEVDRSRLRCIVVRLCFLDRSVLVRR
jgi:hypothetical protein